MNQEQAKVKLAEIIKQTYNIEGTLILMSLGEDDNNFYFDVCDIPKGHELDKQSYYKYSISPPWFINKQTGNANINWGIPPEVLKSLEKWNTQYSSSQKTHRIAARPNYAFDKR